MAVRQWDVIIIGNTSRNRYWGEGDEKPVRPAVCTTTLITCDGMRLIADPAFAEADRMAFELDRRTGLKPADVDAVFVTHSHSDHYAGLGSFPHAEWLAAPGVAREINDSGAYPRTVKPAADRIGDDVSVIPTPGHTPDHHSLLFECGGLRIVVAGDAVMRRDFFEDRRGYFNSADPELASRTIERLAAMADIIVPGHDNYFLVRPAGTRPPDPRPGDAGR
jgi:glyoxylase-like metal-dependent hydrolase (beta-lactamase superfamily II)